MFPTQTQAGGSNVCCCDDCMLRQATFQVPITSCAERVLFAGLRLLQGKATLNGRPGVAMQHGPDVLIILSHMGVSNVGLVTQLWPQTNREAEKRAVGNLPADSGGEQ